MLKELRNLEIKKVKLLIIKVKLLIINIIDD